MFTNRDVLRLEGQLRSTDPHLKTRVLRKIGRLTPDARVALLAVHNTAWSPLLLGSLLALETGAALDAASARSRSATEVQMRAAHSVAHLAKGDSATVGEAVASLVAGLHARDAKVRIIASYALSCLGEIAVGALPDLLRVAKSDPDFNVRARAVWALRSMGRRARRAAPLLRRLLRDSDANIRRFAGGALVTVEGESRR